MTETLSHRELRNRSAEVLRAVAAGQTYTITNHGEVVAILSPPPRGGNAALRVRQPGRARNFSALPSTPIGTKSQAVLDDLREER